MIKIYVKYSSTNEVLGLDNCFRRSNDNHYKIRLFDTKDEAIAYVDFLNYGDCRSDKCEYLQYERYNNIIRQYVSEIHFEDKDELYRITTIQTRRVSDNYPEGIQVVLEIFRDKKVVAIKSMVMDHTKESIESFILEQLIGSKRNYHTYLVNKLDVKWGLKLNDRLPYYCFTQLSGFFYKDFQDQFTKNEVE